MVQIVQSFDIFTPSEFKQAVMAAFSEISRQHTGKLQCSFDELKATFDWVNYFKRDQVADAWPNEIGSFKTRDDTIHSVRFQRRVKARDDRP